MTLNEFIQTASLPIAIIVIGIVVLWRIYQAQPSEEHSSNEGISGGSL